MAQSDFHKLKAKTIKGEEYDFSQLAGKVVLIVNVASECGFTSQYAELQALHAKYVDQGLVILGFPCNQFGGQEPGNEDTISNFCQVNYGVQFQIMEKCDVNGDNTHPVYAYLKPKKTQMLMERIKWNFEKFLVDKHGVVTDRCSSISTPASMDKDILHLLQKN